MKKFRVTKDIKCSIWDRHTYTVEAETLEQAKKKIERENISPDDVKFISESCEPLSHEENYALNASEHLLAGTGLMETDAEGYETIKYPEELNYEIKT